MFIIKINEDNNTQTITLPNDYRIKDTEVILNKTDDVITIIPRNKAKEAFLKSIGNFSDDFFKDGRNQPLLQIRKNL